MDEAETAKYTCQYELLDANEEKRLSKATSERAKAILELKSIVAPLSGVVVERCSPAASSRGRRPILRLAQIDHPGVSVHRARRLFGGSKLASRPKLSRSAAGWHMGAKVTGVDRVIDAASGTFGVRLALPTTI